MLRIVIQNIMNSLFECSFSFLFLYLIDFLLIVSENNLLKI